MSPRAAWQLETMMFDRVYDYVAGKNDWLSHGLPIEGASAAHKPPLAIDAAQREVPTCRYTDRLGHVNGISGSDSTAEWVVLNGEGIVLGRLADKAFDHDPDTPVAQVMEPGPTTIRPGTPLDEIIDRMKDARVSRVLVTSAEGKLVGVLRLEDAEKHLAQAVPAHQEGA